MKKLKVCLDVGGTFIKSRDTSFSTVMGLLYTNNKN